MKPIRGTTERCLAHLGKAIEGRELVEKRRYLANFIKVHENTMIRYLANGTLPGGDSLVRLQFYLEFLGYDVIELKGLKPQVRDAARLYAFDIVSLPEIGEIAGYGGDDRQRGDSMLRLFRGAIIGPERRLVQLSSLFDLYGSELAEKQEQTVNVLLSLDAKGAASAANSLRATPAPSGDPDMRAEMVEVFARMATAMLPLAEHLLSDSFSVKDREHVRELAGEGVVSRLSRALTRMVNEAARNALSPENREGSK